MPSLSSKKHRSPVTRTKPQQVTPRPYTLPSVTDDWATPQDTFDKLHAEFNFTLDPCASDTNHKCPVYFTREQNGLLQDWGTETVYCNPPYGREIADWMAKADSAARAGATVVMLVPSRTGTKWYHRIAKKHEVRFLEGRLKFGGSKNAAPFDSMVVVFRPPTTNMCCSTCGVARAA